MVMNNDNRQGQHVEYVENSQSRHRPSGDVYLKEFSEKDQEYEEELNKTSPSLKYRTELQRLRDIERQRREDKLAR